MIRHFKITLRKEPFINKINDVFDHISMPIKVTVLVKGGGYSSQADAIRLGSIKSYCNI